jgi:chemotaxis response regulator CheB
MTSAIAALIIAEDGIMQALYRRLIASAAGFRLVGAVSDAGLAVARVQSLLPAVILFDLDPFNPSRRRLLLQLSLVTRAPVLCLGSSCQPGSEEAAVAYAAGAALVMGKLSGPISMDFEQRQGPEVLDAMRRLATDVR